jgi:hypothetical protein
MVGELEMKIGRIGGLEEGERGSLWRNEWNGPGEKTGMACESNTHMKRKNEAEWQEGNSRGERDSVARKHLVIKMPEGDLNLQNEEIERWIIIKMQIWKKKRRVVARPDEVQPKKICKGAKKHCANPLSLPPNENIQKGTKK